MAGVDRVEELRTRTETHVAAGRIDASNRPTSFAPPLTVAAFAAVEAALELRLPDELRVVVTRIADGGSFTRYGVWPLREMVERTITLLSRSPAEPFDPLEPKLTAGGLLLFEHAGEDAYSGIVATGPHAGEVWLYTPNRWWPACDRGLGVPFDSDGEIPWWNGRGSLPMRHWNRVHAALLRDDHRHLRLRFIDYLMQGLEPDRW